VNQFENSAIKECFGYEPEYLQQAGGTFTATEILQQPRLWRETFRLLKQHETDLCNFLHSVYQYPDLTILVCGAGTSAYIGTILQGSLQRHSGKRTVAVSTTDLVSHPSDYFLSDSPTLLISFARSGNSPESVAAVELANQLCERIYHLVITCNPDGQLAKTTALNDNCYSFFMPSMANDKSLAMTGSFSSMLLAGILISRLTSDAISEDEIEQLSYYGNYIFENFSHKIKEVANLDFNRTFFLGSGPFQGAARESQLKMQEFTNGTIMGGFDTFLGFRHGPKVVINPSTIIIYLFSNNDYVSQYEDDLVADINRGEKGIYQIGIRESSGTDNHNHLIDMLISLPCEKKLDEDLFSVCSVLPAQLLGFLKSLQLGLNPDSPSLSNTITRVVEGVNIYPYTGITQISTEHNHR
jgi:tagatose-6-phosphate ketose/aldose isomerase